MDSWDYSIFWKEALKNIREEISEIDNAMWFNNIKYSASGEKTLFLTVPSNFFKEQVIHKFGSLIQGKLSDLTGSDMKIEFVVSDTPEPEKNNEPHEKTKIDKVHDSIITGSKETKQKENSMIGLNFDNFVIGENNSFAANACIAISKNPGKSYNPCLIYGGVGLGKTHLLRAIENYIAIHFDKMKVVYVTAEQFTNEFIEMVRNKQMHKFKSKYRKVDVLLIDDIHFLEKKETTQEELFHTFNALYDYNKQMVFTCDRPVSELKNLTDRLRSRFQRGLNVDLQAPSYETRVAIAKQKLDMLGVRIDDDVIDIICQNITTNVRDLESAIIKITSYSTLLNKKITVSIAKEQLRDAFTNTKQGNINIDHIQKVVANFYNLSHNDLRGKKRTKAIAFPRQVAMYITREITEYSTTEVGVEFGGRDHSTVMHACQRIESKMKSDPSLEPVIQRLIRMIKDNTTS